MIRPIRIGLVIEPTLASIRNAVELATSSWGGCYFPLLPTDDAERHRLICHHLDVDVVVGVGADSPIIRETGFVWRAAEFYGPFSSDKGARGVLDVAPILDGWGYGAPRFELAHPIWQENDPWATVLTVWH